MVRTRADELEESSTTRLDRMERMMQDMAKTLRQQQQWQQQWQHLQPPPSVQPIPDMQNDNRTIALTKEFKKIKPPLFHGGVDPLKAEAWVLGIEKLFEVLPCLETQKVQLATFTLEDEARRWWMLISDDNKGIDWAQFLALFYEKYFPQCVHNRNVSEFEGLIQGSLTVAEYEAKFTELARFAPHMVDTHYKKARKFDNCLRNDILERVNVLKLPTYVDVLDRALMSKANMANRGKPLADWKAKR
ncbi:uncharacterized protein LOC114313397 [Camellia sinensis]|uniref:uncharacterized protein LOC114313397 n=1 Tax=Camellia sinensis TaxID=4442 RepID=UPI0010359672|nr:uncharacterized protein LOC114313397 [Camellia sinensis]